MNQEQKDLYEKIQAFSLDEPGSSFTFTQRLASENGWDAAYTQRVVQEYKRFVFLAGNHANASAQVGGIKLTAAEKHGRELFGQDCAVCHTLSAANAIGKVGPNLDSLKPPAQLVLNTINNGCVQNPPANSPQACLGQGTMPAQLVEGKDAQDVSNFVAKVAGNE